MSVLADSLRQLLSGMQADQRQYIVLQDLLDEQLAAIAQQRAEKLEQLAARITALTGELDASRLQRRAIVARLLGREQGIALEDVFARVPAGAAQVLRDAWTALELAVRHCKALNTRNCELIIEQHALMQRLMGVEQDTYAEL